MIKIVHLFMVIFLVLTGTPAAVFAQHRATDLHTSNPSNPAPAADIAYIRMAYAKINSSLLKQTAFKFDSPGCVDDGLITYFRDEKKNILKITDSGSIGDGSWTTEFYFYGGKLIFCYDKMIGGAAAEPASTVEYRVYVKNDLPLRCMEGKKIVAEDSKARTTIQTAYRLLSAYTTRNFKFALCDE